MIEPRRALFIQLRKIGDTLLCTPAVRAFKKRYPECQLDFLTEYPDILKGNNRISEIISADKSKSLNPFYQYSLIRKLRSRRYDIVVDFFVNPRSAYYAYLTGAPNRLSYGYRHRRWAYNLVPPEPKEQLYAANYKLRLLEAIEIPPDGPELEYSIDETSRRKAAELLAEFGSEKIVALSPISFQPYNRWPLDRYAEIAKRLIEQFHTRIIILSGPGEKQFADSVSRQIGDRGQKVFNIQSLPLLGAIFQYISLYLGNDNGTKHIAVACKTPTFSIYGPQNPISWTYPDYKNHQWVIPTETYDGSKREHVSNSEPIENISVEQVWSKLVLFLRNLPAFDSSLKHH